MGGSNSKDLTAAKECVIVKPELQDVLAVHMLPYLEEPWHLRTTCRAMMKVWDQNHFLNAETACPYLEMTFQKNHDSDDDSYSPPPLGSQREGKEARALHRGRLLRFYQHYAPDELQKPEVRENLEKTIKAASKGEKGGFKQLWLDLEGKYGPESKVPGYLGTTLVSFDGDETSLEKKTTTIPVSLATINKSAGGLTYGLKKTLPYSPPFQLCHLHFEKVLGLTTLAGRLPGLPVDRISSFPFLKKVTVKSLPHLVTIGDEFLAHCDLLEEVVIEDLPSLTSVGNDWLRGCTELKNLIIKDLPQLESVGGHWIHYCPKLGSLTMEGLSELRHVGDNWLGSCRNLRGTLTFSGEHFPSLSTIGEKWLVDSTGLDELHLKDLKLLKSIKGDWLAESGIEKLHLSGLKNFHPGHEITYGLLRAAHRRSILRVEIQPSSCSEHVLQTFKDSKHEEKIDIIE